MIIISGTTEKIAISFNIPWENIQKAVFTFKDAGGGFLRKQLSDLVVEGDKRYLYISQEETKHFKEYVRLSAKVVLAGDEQYINVKQSSVEVIGVVQGENTEVLV